MSFYHERVLPLLINLSMRQRRLASYRAQVVPAAQGRVLEIGIGSGLNLPYYGAAVERVIGLDPSPRLIAMAQRSARKAAFPVELIEASAEAIPLESGSVDTVLTTWTLCTIPDVERALSEMRRVLKPAGRLLFVEHGRSPDTDVCRWQDRLTPLWQKISGGCHLNRAISALIAGAGFRIARLETGYMRGPKPLTFMYKGCAQRG